MTENSGRFVSFDPEWALKNYEYYVMREDGDATGIKIWGIPHTRTPDFYAFVVCLNKNILTVKEPHIDGDQERAVELPVDRLKAMIGKNYGKWV